MKGKTFRSGRLAALCVALIATNMAFAQSQTISCSSDDMGRHSCAADTRGGVRLSRQISGSPCTENSTWGYDKNGIWVDKGCRAEFQVLPAAAPSAVPNILSNVSPELISQLTKQFSITPAQATGGAGALFSLAKSRLTVAEFAKVATAVPGMASLLKSAPEMSGLSGISNVQGSLGGVASLAPVAASFQKLGLSPDMAGKFVPVLTSYVQSKGGSGTSALLAKALPASQPTPAAAAQIAKSAEQVTIPEGTTLSVRLIDPVDTEKNKDGDTFRGSLDSPILIQDRTVIPKNADVQAQLVSSKSAGHFTGSSAVVLVVSKITVDGITYDIQTEEFTKEGASRGKRSAEIIGGGAAAGAVIGAIVGGGKGAAIGAAAGAGAGTGVQALTKGEQIKLPSETVLEFHLKAPLTVSPAAATEKREALK